MSPAVRRASCGVLLALLWACGAAAPTAPSKHVARDRIIAAVDALDPARPLELRYNPAPCDCPVFELRLGRRWVRASWPGVRQPAHAALAARLAATSARVWPIPLRVRGQVERDVRRTRAGGYALVIEVSEVLELAGEPASSARGGITP